MKFLIFQFIFLFAFASVFLLMNYYSYKRFLKKLYFLNSSKARKWIIVIIICVCFFELLFVLSLRYAFMNNEILFIAASLIGVSFMVFCVAIVYDLLNLPISKIPFNPSRRLFVKVIFDITILILAFSYLLKGFLNGFKMPIVKEIKIKLNNLNNPINLVQVSDIHIGKFLGKKYLQKIVNIINAQNPDIVVITGDLVDLEVSKIEDKMEPLRGIKSKNGVYFVPGNHEYYHGVEDIIEYLKTLDIIVLENSNTQVCGINLAGVYDLAGFKINQKMIPDINQALRGINPKLPTVLLSHQPKIVNFLGDFVPIDLILSGHTHGGQIFPFGLLVMLDQPYLHGHYWHNDKTQIYVSSGAGFWGPPVRFLAPSEIVKINLV